MAEKPKEQSKSRKRPNLSDNEYEKIGRMMESIVIHGYAGKKRLFSMNFLRGVFFGIGSTLGATIMLALILYGLSLFSELPLVGDIFESIENTIDQRGTPQIQ